MNHILSTFKNKRFMVLWILGFVISLSGFTNLSAQTKTWIGGIGNWNVSSNWSPAGIPGASDIVLITSGDVSVPGSYTAYSKSVEVNFGAKLRVLSGAELQSNGSANDGIRVYANNTEIINDGIVRVGNTTSIATRGLVLTLGGKFTNNSGALLEINRVSSENGIEIRDVNTKLTNSGTIKVGNIATINFTCMWIHSSGQCENKSGATIELNNTLNYHGIGIGDANSKFENYGHIKIGFANKISYAGLAVEGGATFYNYANSVIEIDDVNGYFGLLIGNNGTIYNYGHFKIGSIKNIGWRCIDMYSNGKLTNYSSGIIELNRSGNGIEMNGLGTKVTNHGLFKIGSLAPINSTCVYMTNKCQFENTSSGAIELNNTNFSHGIYANGVSTQFDNYGSVRMGFATKIQDIGIYLENGSRFRNFISSTIEIDSVKNRDGIRCIGSSTQFDNWGTLKIGKTNQIGSHGISISGLGCVFNNQSSGAIEVNRSWTGINIIGAAQFNNSGMIRIGNLAPIIWVGLRLAGSGLSSFTNQIGGLIEVDNVPNSFGVEPGNGTSVSNYGVFKMGLNGSLFRGIGTSFGVGTFDNYGLLEFKSILENGIHSNQTLNNNPGSTISIPLNGKLQIANLGILNNTTGSFVNNFGTVTNNGVINNSGTFNNQSIYKGTGVFNTSLFNNPVPGTVAPGSSLGCLQFTNGWASLGKLEIEINGPVSCSDYDQIQVTGNAQVGGNLYINFNYTPACGATFQLINATTHSGSFANIFITPNTITASYSNGVLSILDVIAPSIICPSNVEYTTVPGDCGPIPSSEINLGSPVTSDNCGVAGTSNNAPSTYALGVKNVKWTVTDLSGNTNTCIQKVTIKAGSCGTPQQVYHTDITQTSAKVNWNAGVPCATDYQLRIRYEISPGVWSSWSSWSNHSGPGLEHLFSGLSPNRFYHYQIRSKCGSATNSNSINGWFTTLPSGGSLKRIDNAKNKSYTDLDLFNNRSQENIPDLTRISVFPNPAKEWLVLSISGFNLDEKQMSIIDLSGKLISIAKLQASENELEIDLHNLTSGIYYLRVSSATKQNTIQFVIEK